MAARRAEHKKISFGAVLLVYAAVLAVLIVAGLCVFSSFIGHFELSRPEYAVESFISERLDERFFIEKMTDSCPVDVTEFESPEVIVRNYCVKQLRGKEFTYSKRPALSKDGSQVFWIMADGEPVCSLTLTSGGDIGFGFTSYEAERCEIIDGYFKFETRTIIVEVPVGAAAYVNGVKVAAKYLTGREPFGGQSKFQAASDSPLMLDVYTINGLYAEPNVASGEGDQIALAPSDDGIYECPYPEESYHTVSVKAPSSAVVKINGVALGAEELESTLTAVPSNGFDGEQSLSVYKVGGLAGGERVTVSVGGIETPAVEFAENSYVADVPEKLKYSVRISVPDSADVYIGDRLVPKTYVVQSRGEYGFLECAKAYVGELPYCMIYEADGLYDKPEVTVKHGSKVLSPVSMIEDGRALTFEYTLPSDASLSEKYSETAYDFVRAYIVYTSGGWQDIDAHLDAVLGKMLSSSDLYKRISDSKSSIAFNSPYGSCEYKKLEAYDFVAYSESCFSCTVAFDVSLARYSGANVYAGTMRLIFVDSDGWRVCGMEVS